ncbi:MAG: GntR family transcriptional regulator [Acidimicrobiales bacterium]
MSTPASPSNSDPLLAVPSIRGDRSAEEKYRAPHVADLVVAELRRRILDGELDDGDELPRQEDLLKEFGVSKPSMREALRILESEGLLSVRRGKVGGAVVHRPGLDNAAYVLGTVLRSTGAPVDDVARALNQLESQCVAMCAGRDDRAETVVPALRDVNARAAACIDDVRQFTIVSREFHEALVQLCGSPTLTLVVGALESVWTAHADAWAELHDGQGDFPDRAYRQQGVDDHEALIDLIEAGDMAGAAAENQRHLAWAPVYALDPENVVFPGLLAERPDK